MGCSRSKELTQDFISKLTDHNFHPVIPSFTVFAQNFLPLIFIGERTTAELLKSNHQPFSLFDHTAKLASLWQQAILKFLTVHLCSVKIYPLCTDTRSTAQGSWTELMVALSPLYRPLNCPIIDAKNWGRLTHSLSSFLGGSSRVSCVGSNFSQALKKYPMFPRSLG